MEADLMRWMFESCQRPKRLTADFSVDEILYIVEDRVIGHRTFYDIVIMRTSQAAGDDKIQPFFCHFRKALNTQSRIWREPIRIQIANAIKARCPTNGLLRQQCAVKSKVEVLVVFRDTDLW